ncbi:MAG: hypothetical protein HC846_00400 [Blastocatellia bacterium]|nr:hypothetical protein [Blastocatellia bacterium]
MQLEDLSQNTNLRILTIKIIGLILLTILGIRLYHLQIVKGDYYEEKARNQQIRRIPIPAPRGTIFDRNGQILVDSRPTYNIVIANETLKNIDTEERINAYADGLGLDYKFVSERINFLKKQPNFETMVLKESVTSPDIAWVEAHEIEFPELRVEIQPQRNYVHKPLWHTFSVMLAKSVRHNWRSPNSKIFIPATLSAKAVWSSITTNICAVLTVIVKWLWIVADVYKAKSELFRRNPDKIWLRRLTLIYNSPPKANSPIPSPNAEQLFR